MVNPFLKRIDHAYRALIRPAYAFLFLGLPTVLIETLAFVRDNFTSKEFQEKWEILKLIPHFSLPVWMGIAALIFISILLEGSFRVWMSESSKVIRLEKIIEQLKLRRPVLSGMIEQISLGERPVVDLVSGGKITKVLADYGCVIPFITIKNIGELPSAAVGWKVFIESNGERVHTQIVHMDGNVHLGKMAGADNVSVNSAELIYKKTADPIPVGGLVQGFLIAKIPMDLYNNPVGSSLIIIFEDITGEHYEVRHDFTAKRKIGIDYMPKMDIKIE